MANEKIQINRRPQCQHCGRRLSQSGLAMTTGKPSHSVKQWLDSMYNPKDGKWGSIRRKQKKKDERKKE